LAAGTGETERIRKAAFRALSQLRAWGFEPLNLGRSGTASSIGSPRKSGTGI
jgi:hypothetical protein